MPLNASKPLIFVVISVLVVALVYSSISAFNVFAVQRGDAPPDADCEVDVFSDTSYCCWTETDPGDPEGIELNYCQSCSTNGCNPKRPDRRPEGPTTGEEISPGVTGGLEQPATPRPFDPTAPLQGGVLQQQQTPPTSAPGTSPGVLQQLEQGDFAPGFAPGFLRQQEQQPPSEGAAELLPPPATEETPPATEEMEQAVPVCQDDLEFNEGLGFCVPTDCPEGQALNEEAGICVLEQPEVAEEQEEPEQQQSEQEEQDQEQQSSDEGDNSEDGSN
jgi:hypothetical protein